MVEGLKKKSSAIAEMKSRGQVSPYQKMKIHLQEEKQSQTCLLEAKRFCATENI